MANREGFHDSFASFDERENPSPLPPDLAAFLKSQRIACLLHAADRGTVLVVKAPGAEIESVRGIVPIHLRQELYRHRLAPVIRMVVTIYDEPSRPLALETFVNVRSDEQLRHRLSKRVRNLEGKAITRVLAEANQILAMIPEDRFDFDQAKADVIARTTL